jgi:hypothetical protein
MDEKKKVELKIEELEERIAPTLLGGDSAMVGFYKVDSTGMLSTPANGTPVPVAAFDGLGKALLGPGNSTIPPR